MGAGARENGGQAGQVKQMTRLRPPECLDFHLGDGDLLTGMDRILNTHLEYFECFVFTYISENVVEYSI